MEKNQTPKSNGMNREQKEASKIIAASTEISKTLALMIFGMGRTMTILSLKPRQAAAHMVQAAEELSSMSKQVLDLSERIIEWNEQRVIIPGKALVDVNNKPLESE